MWHNRLDHPSLPIFHKFLSVLSISFPEEHLCSNSCNPCKINKSHKLPFVKSSIASSSHLDVIFSDIWTSRVSSSDGFHYYVIFVDHYTKYMVFTNMLFLLTITQSTSGFTRYVVSQMFIQPLSPSSTLLKTTTIKTLYTDNEANF